MHVYMYNTFNIHAILVYVTYLMYDYINHDFTPKHSTDTGKSLSFPGHPTRHLYGKGWTPHYI